MILNNIPINADLSDILRKLKEHLVSSGIEYLRDIKDSPDNIMVTCPYHGGGKERKPSAGIKKSNGVFHCFACGETHSLQEVISYCLGYTSDVVGAQGWSWILQNFITIGVEERDGLVLELDRSVHSSNPVRCVSEEELESYRVYHPYMWKRKMTPEVVEIFDIGYDEKRGAITFPVRDEKGRCLFIARRSVHTKFFNYPSGVTKPVYGLYELLQLTNYPKEVIICESMIDAITAWVYGKYAVALNGLGNDLQFEQLNKMPCRKFILATDNDTAGQTARSRLRKNIRGKLITELVFPKGKKDINDLTKEEFLNLEEIF